jgi:activator of HSP90 ATPase
MSSHQQAVIPASPDEVYTVLADAQALSALSGMSGHAGRTEGAEFSAFDGHVTGRQIELVSGQRIVQAWRLPAWEPGRYSVVRFSLDREDGGTRLVIDQHGAPEGQDTPGCLRTWHDHLDTNWPVFYSAPLTRHFTGQDAS